MAAPLPDDEPTGDLDQGPMPRSGSHRRRILTTRTGIVLVSLALFANVAVGILLIVTRAQVEQGEQDRLSLLACFQKYNELTGDANASRDRAARKTTNAAKTLWGDLLRLNTLAREEPERTAELEKQFLQSTRRYIDRLETANDRRDDTPFPPADLCSPAGEKVKATEAPRER